MELRDLQRMTVVKLREEAGKHEGLEGVSAMKKNQLITALAPILGIDLDAASKAVRVKFAADKPALKREIRALKAQRDAALAEHDTTTVHQVRQRIKKHKRTLRRMAHETRTVAV
jgi:hypothetical protein